MGQTYIPAKSRGDARGRVTHSASTNAFSRAAPRCTKLKFSKFRPKPAPGWGGKRKNLLAFFIFFIYLSTKSDCNILVAFARQLQLQDCSMRGVCLAAFCCRDAALPLQAARCNLCFLKEGLEAGPDAGSFDLSLALH